MILQPATGASGAATPQLIRAICLSSDAPGDAVRIAGDRSGEYYRVTKVDIDSMLPNVREATAIGVIRSKLSTTLCYVQIAGECRGLYTGMTPGSVLFVGTNGRLSELCPPRPSTGKRLVHTLGRALASDVVLVQPWNPTIVVAD